MILRCISAARLVYSSISTRISRFTGSRYEQHRPQTFNDAVAPLLLVPAADAAVFGVVWQESVNTAHKLVIHAAALPLFLLLLLLLQYLVLCGESLSSRKPRTGIYPPGTVYGVIASSLLPFLSYTPSHTKHTVLVQLHITPISMLNGTYRSARKCKIRADIDRNIQTVLNFRTEWNAST